MDLKLLAVELESFAEGRWKGVVPLITQHHCGDLLEVLDGITDADDYSRRLHNNTQRIQRAFRNDTANYRQQARELAPAVRAAIEAEQRQLHDEHSLIANANRECTEATNAVLMRKPKAVIHREGIEAIAALAELIGINIDLSHAQQRAA
ncbi:toxin YdaT domain-containing protein [Scandinavium goeteborgense]|uniref:toxin YdaT domain-containing protein n=1 Tax=Scandinavium goeteborgense TaxID=1851514 RepID=UPI002165297C|nr:toxin YdaT domain-containing protein [Scandinavium goeteborgense]MCS2154740.1 toxin YdaT domain-containing protein [Scandinavium goeteborgense]